MNFNPRPLSEAYKSLGKIIGFWKTKSGLIHCALFWWCEGDADGHDYGWVSFECDSYPDVFIPFTEEYEIILKEMMK